MMAEAIKPKAKKKTKAKKGPLTVVSSDKLNSTEIRNGEVEKVVEDKGLKLHEFELADSRRTSESVIGKTEESPPKETTENCITLESPNNINSEMAIVDQCDSVNNISNNNKETVQSEKLQVAGNIASSDIITSTKFQAPSAPLAQEQTPIYSYRESNSQRELPKLIESSSYGSKCSNLYPTLPSNKLLTIVNNQVSPSCPNEVHLSSSNVKTIYPELHAENSKMHKPKPQLVNNEVMLRSNEIRPLTKDQLKQLYSNPELDRNETYIETFIKSEQSIEHHWLHKLILKYAKAREDYALSEKCIKDLKNEYSRERDKIWEDFPETVVEKSICMDRKTVKATRSYIRTSYNQRIHDAVKNILENTYKEIEKNYCLHLHVMETTKLLIESHLYSISSSSTFKDIPETAPVTGYEIRNCSEIDHSNIQHLKQCISVLFCFQRRLTKDEEFLKETRIWLTSLVALLLRVATYEDHLFILNHILRCPARVGSWACSYMQSPTLPSWSNARNNTGFKSPLLDHTITMLATLLYPVRSREVFLQHFKSSVMLATGCDAPQDNHWVFIDSDNEEDLEAFDMWLRWEESDIVSFFTQIPFGNMFRFLLKIEESEAIEKYNPEKYESTEMLKLLSVATHLVSIFHEGFKTFRSGKYRQLTKYITRYISDSVKYVCEHWECVSKMNNFDSAFTKRLQAEFDEFIFRAVSCISSAPRKEAWQFLIFPYRSVSSEMMWKLAWVLFTYPERQEVITIPVNDMVLKLQDEKLKNLFQETIESLEFNEAYYLLSALAEMVNSRGWDEHQFVHTITLILFEVAFTARTVREKMSKGGRDMIKTIVEKHPYVVSSVLRELKDKINDVGKASIYLFKELPLQGWKPTQEDINIVSHWLLSDDFPLKSSTNQLARLIISNINWGRNEEGTELMLDISIHQKIAVLIVEAYGKFIKVQDNKSYIVWAYEQLASFASAVKSTMSTATSTDEEGFIKWAWEMLFTLRLHSLDQANPPYEDVLKGCVISDGIPTIHQDVWVLPLSSINDSPVNCTACYVAILLTSIGHRADLIREEGFSLLQKLIENKQYVAAISVLPYIMPFFYKDFNGLVKNEIFNKCVQLLLTADIDDMSYLQKAKSMVVSETLGKVLPVMGSMIKFQVEKAKPMNASCDVVRLWLRILFEILITAIKTGKLDKWKGSNQVYYLLDEISRIAFTDTCMRDVAFMEIKSVEKDLSLPVQEGSSFIDTLASLMIPKSPQKASFLSDSIPCKYLWFTWFSVHTELESTNSKNIWKQLLLELAVQPSITVSDALKKVTGSLKIKMPINCLPIYKWGQLIMKTPSTHPLLPLFCQQFFIYYLQRIPISQGLSGKVCLGKTFFENNNIIGSLKEMKVHLLAARDENYKLTVYYEAQLSSDKIPRNRQELLMNKKEFYERLVKLYDAFTLWLEAPRLQEATVVISDLPERYDPSRLSCVLSHDVDPWFMFVDVQKLQEDVNEQLNAWHCYNKFSEVASVVDMKMPKESSEQRILRKLNSYSAPKPPPPIKRSKPPLKNITEEIFDNYKILNGVIEKDLEILKESIEWFSNQMLKERELDREYHNDIMQLCNNKEKKISCKVSCSKGEENTPGGCTGAAIIFMSFEEKEIDEKVKQAIYNNRINHHILLTSLLEPLGKSFYYAAAHMSKCFEILLLESKEAYQSRNLRKHQELCEMGKMLFYYLLDCFDDNINSFQPTKVFLTEQLQFLFVVFQEDESQGMQLLQSLTSHPFVESLLPVIDQFNPLAHSGNSYVETYTCLVEQIHKLPLNVTLTLVNKFDIPLWLHSSKRMFEERTKLIHALGRALCKFGHQLNEMGSIYEVYNDHLRVMLIYNFPEHYYEILNMLLSGTDSPSLPKEAWTTFLHSLGLTLTSEITIDNKEIIEQYASKQSFLSLEEVSQTLHLLGDHFERNCKTAEKLDLYKKYSYYMPSIINILAAMSHTFIHTTLSVITHNENDLVVELWKTLKKTYSPWLYPTQKRSPWSQDSTSFAALMFGSYTMCLCYLEKNIKDCFQGASILPMIWRFYVETYSQKYVEDHVRATAQECLSPLKWNEFSPELEDISLMIELVESQIPENVNFVSSIFVKISWTNINYLSGGANEATSDTEILPVLTKLIVKLAWEPAIIAAGTLPQILKSAEACSWHLVSFKTLEQVVNIFVEKCNPQCILQEKQNGSMDSILLRFLRITTCMEPLELLRNHPDTLCHRLLFMATCVDLLKKCSVTNPELLKEKQNLFLKAVYNILQQIEISTKYNVPQPERFKQTVKMLGQFLVILSDQARVELKDFVMMGLIQWFEERPDSYLVLPCLQASCKSVNCMQYLVKIVECCILKHFYTNKEAIYVLRYLMVPEQYEEDFLTACSKENMHLSQYIYAEQKLLEYKDKEDIRLLNMLVDWNEEANPQQSSEPKLILLWDKLLALALRQIDADNESDAKESLKRFIKKLTSFGKESSFIPFLNKATYQVTPRFRFLSRFVAAFVSVQIPDNGSIRIEAYAEGHITYTGASSPVAKEKTFCDGKCKPSQFARDCVQRLESLLNSRQYANMKDYIEEAVNSVMDANNHFRNIRTLLKQFATRLYDIRCNKFLELLNQTLPEER